ncbi:hypothetical protein EON65_26120 [archaeon]|nr:MAG: hypothetical protein EON65_26120 [archaeon]
MIAQKQRDRALLLLKLKRMKEKEVDKADGELLTILETIDRVEWESINLEVRRWHIILINRSSKAYITNPIFTIALTHFFVILHNLGDEGIEGRHSCTKQNARGDDTG